MASKVTKVRLVRCPKCYKLLPEFPTLLVYQCGGCGITLKAKKIKEGQEGESSEAVDHNSAQKIVPEHDFEDKDSTCSSQETIVRSTDGCEQVDHDWAKRQSASRRFCSGITSSSELDWHKKEDSLSDSGKSITAHGNHERRRSEMETPSYLSEELDMSEKIVRRYADLIGLKLPVKASEATDDGTISDSDMVGNKHADSVEVLQPPAAKGHHACDASVSSSDDSGDQVSDHRSRQSKRCLSGSQQVAEIINSKVETIPNDISVDSRIGTELDVTTVQLDPVKAAEATTDSIILEDAVAGNKLVGSVGVLEPPAAKRHHAYDASISSNDGWGDQVSDLQSHQSLSGSHRVAELVSSTGEAIPKYIPVNNRVGKVLEVQNQAMKSSKMSANKKSGPTVASVSVDQNELPENTKYSIKVEEKVNLHNNATRHNPVQSRLGPKSEELKAKKPFGQRDSAACFENSGPSKYRHNEFSRSSSCTPKTLEIIERNQIELLRKVDELRDQLSRSYVPSGKSNERISMIGNHQERQHPLYCNSSLQDEVMLPHYDVNFPRQAPGTYRPSKLRPFQSDYSQMCLSENATNCRHHSNCPCSYGYKENCQCIQKLLPPNLCHNERMCQIYPGHVCCSLYTSGPSSAERHLHCRHPLRSGEIHTLPFDQIERVHTADNLHHHRERRQPVKRHYRPMAGAAPFLRCYCCHEVLYLPADSFLSNKRCHRLQCGSCSKVLVFSLQRTTHILPYSLKTSVTPLGEFASSCDSTSTRNSVSAFRVNDHPQVDRKHPLGRNIKSMETQNSKTTAKKPGNKQKVSVRVWDTSSQSSDEASKEELVQPRIGSPLHRLMGYSSVSRILYVSDA